jgi:DMSO/TMAO reductase YedYZ molybdopterin-dependent catalytic subunit
VRLRVERQLGYKQAKYVMRIEAVASLAGIGGARAAIGKIRTAMNGMPESDAALGRPKFFPHWKSRSGVRQLVLLTSTADGVDRSFFTRAVKRGSSQSSMPTAPAAASATRSAPQAGYGPVRARRRGAIMRDPSLGAAECFMDGRLRSSRATSSTC